MALRHWLIASTAALVLGLSGCKTTEDPSQGGFMSGMANLSDGTYDKRIQDREQALENEQDVNLQRTRSAERLNAQSDHLRSQRQAVEARYSAMQSELNSLRVQLAKADAVSAQQQAEVQALEDEINSLQSRMALLERDTFTPDADKQARLEALEAEREALEREVDLLMQR